MIPNKRNFCGGNFQDWLEVMLTDKCNGKCSWCIEKGGYRPKHHAHWTELAFRTVESGQTNIILLGGEPTLYPDLEKLIKVLCLCKKKVYITTNGSRLGCQNGSYFASDTLFGIQGVNISIHDSNLKKNKAITGINIEELFLQFSIRELQKWNATARLNCNLIQGHIDCECAIDKYIEFAKHLGVDSVRFAELKQDPDNFVNLHDIYGDKYGINNEPFGLGCNTDVEMNGMPVNFRQMCGLQTNKREAPIDPQQLAKTVLYYDGEFYNGWQTKESNMTEQKILELLLELVKGNVSIIHATNTLTAAMQVANPDQGDEDSSEEIVDSDGHTPKQLVDAALAGHPLGCQY